MPEPARFVILGGFLGLVALIGFWEALRDAWRLLILAPILAVVGSTLVRVSHYLIHLVATTTEHQQLQQATKRPTRRRLCPAALCE